MELSKQFARTLLLLFLENMALTKRNKSSRPEVFCKKGVLKNFAKFTEKYMC